MSKINQWDKYRNWIDWESDLRKHCVVDGHIHDISWYYYNLYHPNNKIYHDDGNCIHHKDLNHENNEISNLLKLYHSEHSKLHMTEEHKKNISKSQKGNKNCLGKHWLLSLETKRKQSESHKGEKNPMYGKHLSEETKRNLSEVNIGNKYAAKRIISNFKEYSSCTEAAKSIGVHPSTITYRIKSSKFPGYSIFIKKEKI